MRQIHINENLSNQTLQGNRQSYFENCNIDGTVFIGDWRGSDYLNCTGAADWSNAKTYACYWRGNTLIGSQFPSDIGFFQNEPVVEIIIQSIENIPTKEKDAIQSVHDFVKLNYNHSSWDTSRSVWWDGKSTAYRNTAIINFRSVFSQYTQLAERFEQLVKALQGGKPTYDGIFKSSTFADWPDAKVKVDKDNLPVLPNKSRYELARWIENQVKDKTQLTPYAFVLSTNPPNIWVMPNKNDWLKIPRGGF